jgi:hypothetical protein
MQEEMGARMRNSQWILSRNPAKFCIQVLEFLHILTYVIYNYMLVHANNFMTFLLRFEELSPALSKITCAPSKLSQH